MPSQYGTDYSRFLNAPSSPTDPFQNPTNDAQRVENARARAARAGTDIGSGYLNPKSGELQDPDRGFGRAILSRPEIMIPLVIGSGFGVGALAGPASAAPTSAAASAVPEISVTTSPVSGLSIPTASSMAGPSGGSMGIGSVISKGLDWLGRGSDAFDTVGRVGDRLTSAAQGSRDARMQDSDLLLKVLLAQQNGANSEFSAGLQSAEFQRQEQDRQRKAAILSQLLNNTQDSSITPGNPAIAARMPTMTGGARPSNLTTNRESLLSLLSQPGPSAPTYNAPPMPQLPQGGAGENILGYLGLGTSLLGSLGRRPQTPQQVVR